MNNLKFKKFCSANCGSRVNRIRSSVVLKDAACNIIWGMRCCCSSK